MCSVTYVVLHGRRTGFYSSLEACHAQVDGFDGSLYITCNSLEEAYSAWMKYWSRASLMRWKGDSNDEAFMAYMSDVLGKKLEGNVWSEAARMAKVGGVIVGDGNESKHVRYEWGGICKQMCTVMALIAPVLLIIMIKKFVYRA